jgi:hypothetical protein
MKKMMKSAPVLAVLAISFLLPSTVVGEGAEITVSGSQISGDFGSDVESDRQAINLRLTFGDRTQVRIDAGFLRVRGPSLGIVTTPFGPVTVGPNRKGGGGGSGGSGGGSGGGDGGGGGGGGGGSGGGITAMSGTFVTAAEATDPDEADEWVSGAADVGLTLSHMILGGGAKIYRLDADLRLKAPVADEQEYLGTGEWDYRLGMSGQYRFWSMTGFGGIGWNMLGDPSWVELEDVLDIYAGVESEPLAEKVIVSGWLEGNEEVVAGTGNRTALGVGVRTTGKVRYQGQLTAGLGGSAEDFSVLFGVNFGVDRPRIGRRSIR